jgi:hypothetical protein
MILIIPTLRLYTKIKIMRTKQLFFAVGLILILLQIQVNAQDESFDRIKSIKVAYITERLNLTPQEAEVFWPVYNDFENRKGEIHHNRRKLTEEFMKNQENLSDAEVIKMIDEYTNYNKAESELMVQFDKKFREILPPGKVMKLIIAEVQFRNYLINKFREQHDRPGSDQN